MFDDTNPIPTEVTEVIVQEKLPMMLNFPQNFDSMKVENPAKSHPVGNDPYWHTAKDVKLLCDPLDRDKVIGYWDEIAVKANIFGKGFLFKNSKIEGQFEFDRDPDADPFEEEKEGK